MTDIRTNPLDGALEVVMDRPARKNALTVAMYDEMAAILARASADENVRAVLLRGEGGIFTSGNDLNDFMQRRPANEDSGGARFLAALLAFDKPLVAAVEGHAIGIGTTMLLHCDLVYAAQGARLQLPFVSLGLVPEGASSLLLPRLAGPARAAELLYLGEPFDAEAARELGIVNRVLSPAELLPFARERVAALAAKPLESLRQTKRLLRAPLLEETRACMQTEFAAFNARLGSADVTEAITAFFENRAPKFR
jgi:enoyl-CoA hydratase/carnithine racemase